jgi:hypothetical protein
VKKDMILIIGLFERHSRNIKNQIPEINNKFEIKLYDDEDGLKVKQLRAYSIRAHSIYGVINKMGHILETVIIQSKCKNKYQRINGGVSKLISQIKLDFPDNE